MSRPLWCQPCALARPPQSTPALGLNPDGDPACAAHGGTVAAPPAAGSQPAVRGTEAKRWSTKPLSEEVRQRVLAMPAATPAQDIARQLGIGEQSVRRIRARAGLVPGCERRQPGSQQTPTNSPEPAAQLPAMGAMPGAIPAASNHPLTASRFPAAFRRLAPNSPALSPTIVIPIELDSDLCDQVFARLAPEQQLEAARAVFPQLTLEQKADALRPVLCSVFQQPPTASSQ